MPQMKASSYKHMIGCRNPIGVSYDQVIRGDYDQDCPKCSFTARVILK